MLSEVILEIVEFVKESKKDYRKDTPYDTHEFKFSKKPYNIPFFISIYRDVNLVDVYHDVSGFLPGEIVRDSLYLVSGVTHEEPNTIEIEIYINPKKESNKLYNELKTALIDYVNHEFRHIVQMNYNTTPNIIPIPSNIDERAHVMHNRYEYTLLPDETDALMYGWSAVALHRGVSFKSIVIENLDNWLNKSEITQEQYKKLLNHLLPNI